MPKRAIILFCIFVSACASPRAEVPGEQRIVPTSISEPAVAAPRTFATPQDQAVLARAVSATDYSARLLAVETLGLVTDSWAVDELEKRLGDPDSDVRAAAILALGTRGEPRARELLLSVRDDETEDLDLRVLAIRTLLNPSHSKGPNHD